MLRGTDKDSVENLDEQIAVMITSRMPADESANTYLAALQKAIVEKKAIFLRYNSNNEETTERVVEPIGLCYYSANWHLIGWCRLRQDYRDFRVGRIQRLQVKEESFEKKTHQSLQQYLDSVMNAYDVHEVVVRVHKKCFEVYKRPETLLRFCPRRRCRRLLPHAFFDRFIRIFRQMVTHLHRFCNSRIAG